MNYNGHVSYGFQDKEAILSPLIWQSVDAALRHGTIFANASRCGFILPPPTVFAPAAKSSCSDTRNQSLPFPDLTNVIQKQHLLLPSLFHHYDGAASPSEDNSSLPHSTTTTVCMDDLERSDEEAGSEWYSDSQDSDHPRDKRLRATILSTEQACEIYRMRPKFHPRGRSTPGKFSSRALGLRFNVSSKTIRDIWKRLTWTRATQALWTNEEIVHFVRSNPTRDDECCGDARPAMPPVDAVTGMDSLADNRDSARVILSRRRPGRPKGAKDSFPRKAKLADAPRVRSE